MRSQEVDVLMEFLRMPLSSSDEVFSKFSEESAIRRGFNKKRFLFLEGSRDNRVLLVAHADTFWDKDNPWGWNQQQEVVLRHGVIRNSYGGLGADDRAGCAMVWLLKGLGHSILITDGEENGRQGSRWLMAKNPDIAHRINSAHQFVVQLDRMNSSDFKCYEVGTDEFRAYIRHETGYTEPDRESFTDIVTLCRDICGVNLSVGYYDQHTFLEHIVVSEWQYTLGVCRNWLKRKDLPLFRLGGIADGGSR